MEQKMISAIPNINSSKYCKADLSLILQRVITATTRKMYVTISRKNFKQDISEQELQTKYVHRHFKCVAWCPVPYIAVVLLEQSNLCLQLTMGHKYMVFQSQHYDSE